MKKIKLDRIYVEIGNVCNLACSFCPGTSRKAKQMTEAEFVTVCEKIRPCADYIYLHVMGEPLFHPALGRFLEIAAEYGFCVCITTNGVLLSEQASLLLSHADTIHKVSISLHSMEGNGAENAMERYLSDVVDFAKIASERGIHTVLRLWNLDSSERTGRNGENERIEAFLHREFPEEWTKRHDGYRLKKSVFLEYAGIFVWPSESTAEELPTGFCHGLVDQIAVLADGTVVPCCLDSEGAIPLGNLFSTELGAILSSVRAEAMRTGFRERRMVEPLCRKCTYARRFSR